MTKLEYQLIACPYCLDEVERLVFQVIDLNEDEDLLERLLQKKVNAYNCLNCGHEFVLAQSLTVIAPKLHLIVRYDCDFVQKMYSRTLLQLPLSPAAADFRKRQEELAVRENEAIENGEIQTPTDVALSRLKQALPPALTDEDYRTLSETAHAGMAEFNATATSKSLIQEYPGYIYRAVTEYNDLIEKLQIFRQNLDDRALELIKYVSKLSSAKNDGEQAIKRLYFVQADANHLVFLVYRTGGWDYYDLPAETYDNTSLYKDFFTVDNESEFVLIDEVAAAKWWKAILQASEIADKEHND